MAGGDGVLGDIAEAVFSEFGYVPGKVGFAARKDMSFAWSIRGKTLNLTLSDYLADAPPEVVEDFMRGALMRIKGMKPVFGKAYIDHVTSDAFILSKRPVYMRRSRNILSDGHGEVRSLYDSVQRLMDAGLVFDSDIENTVFVWTKKPTYTRLGYCSTMMRMVAVSRALDSERYEERVLDYVVYHEIIHLRLGYRPFDNNPHDSRFRRYERQFPDFSEVSALADKIPLDNPQRKRRRR